MRIKHIYKAYKLKINTFILLDGKFLQSKEWTSATQQWPHRKLFNELKNNQAIPDLSPGEAEVPSLYILILTPQSEVHELFTSLGSTDIWSHLRPNESEYACWSPGGLFAHWTGRRTAHSRLTGGWHLMALAVRSWGRQELSGRVQTDSLKCDHWVPRLEQMAKTQNLIGPDRDGLQVARGCEQRLSFRAPACAPRQCPEVQEARSQAQWTQVREKLKQVTLG